MPLHSALTGSDVHQDKLIGAAIVSDAGKVTTPSAVTPGVGVLRKPLTTETSTGQLIADAGKAFVQRADTDGVGEFRFLRPGDIETYLTTTHRDVVDLDTAGSAYSIASTEVTTVRIRVVLSAAITVADEDITVTIGGATPVVLTVPVAGSGAGIITSSAEIPLSAVQPAGSLITIANDGACTGPAAARVIVELRS